MLRSVALALLAAATAGLGAAASADAAIVTRHDRAGRVITFDVRVPTRVNWYAQVLRRAVHGDEIETAVVRIVRPSRLGRVCGRNAGSCYEGGRDEGLLTIPAGRSANVAHSLLHEYAHHIDDSRSGWRDEEPWLDSWWSARGIDGLLARGRVSFDYELGWGRSIAEIYAEDYVQLHLRTPYGIRWLKPPGRALKSALLRDLR